MEEEKFSILYVDDEEINLRSFQNSFRKKYRIFTALSAEEGLKILDEENIDIILSDQRMPKMTGVEFLKVAAEKFPKANRVLITGYTDFNALENAINEANIFQYVQKPWERHNLDEIISEGIRLQQLEISNEHLTEELKKLNNALIEKNNELEAFNKELIVARDKAQESERLKDEFVKNMSHQTRTPLNAIMAFSELITRVDLTEKEIQQFNKIIIRSSHTLLRTMDKVLEVSRMATEDPEIFRFETRINELIDGWVLKYDLDAEEKGTMIKVHKGFTDPSFTIKIDDLKLTGIICNLLENAIKFSNGNDVELGYEISGNRIVFTIKDSGIGIDKSNSDIIFERFHQLSNPELPLEGLGLGLYIVKKNTQYLDGELKMESELGKGTTFTLTFPFDY